MDLFSLSLSPWLHSPLHLGCFFSFLILYIVGRTPWTGNHHFAMTLFIHRTTQTQNKSAQTFTPRVGFKPTTPVFKRAKTVHVLDRAATVIGANGSYFESIPPVWPCNKIFPWDLFNYYYFPFCSLAFQTVSILGDFLLHAFSLRISCCC
jgi:hypothetical protein